MDILRFQLSGRSAMFKKPCVNAYGYFTYGTIHKIALMGMFGAIVGYGGYGMVKRSEKGNIVFGEQKEMPEYYQHLKHIQLGVEPLSEKGYISKKMQVFNNSVGYASGEKGGNLIVKEQWLENPKWNIYLLLSDKESQKIAEYIIDRKCIYIPYLGKNDHFADISNPELLQGEEVERAAFLDGLFRKSKAEFDIGDWGAEKPVFKYTEALPVAFCEETWMYISEEFVFTNAKLKKYEDMVYRVEHKNIPFY